MNYLLHLPPAIKFFLLSKSNKQVLVIHGFKVIYKVNLPSSIFCSIEKETILKLCCKNEVEKVDSLIRTLKLLILQSSIFFSVKIKLQGVGYKFIPLKNGKYMLLYAGFSYPKLISVPYGITIRLLTEKGNILQLKGSDRVQLTQFARQLRNLRVPDTYKGKGVCLFSEKLVLKEGKKQK